MVFDYVYGHPWTGGCDKPEATPAKPSPFGDSRIIIAHVFLCAALVTRRFKSMARGLHYVTDLSAQRERANVGRGTGGPDQEVL